MYVECGLFDDDDFIAHELCCDCKGIYIYIYKMIFLYECSYFLVELFQIPKYISFLLHFTGTDACMNKKCGDICGLNPNTEYCQKDSTCVPYGNPTDCPQGIVIQKYITFDVN